MVSLKVQHDMVMSMATYEAMASIASQLFPPSGGATGSADVKPISNVADLKAMVAAVNG